MCIRDRPKKAHKVLIFSKTHGFRHSSIETGVEAFKLMGEKTGAYTADATEDDSAFEPENLKKYDAIVFLNTTGDTFTSAPAGPRAPQPPKVTGTPEDPKVKDAVEKFERAKADFEAAMAKHTEVMKEWNKSHDPKDAAAREERLKQSLVDFVKSGKGLMGTHSAIDTNKDWKEYNDMMGGVFDGHPWHKLVGVKNLEPNHVLLKAFGGMDFEITDEIYQFRKDTASPDDRRMLLALDKNKTNLKAGNRGENALYPIAWLRKYGEGRTFYCSLGHREEIYWNPVMLQFYLAGLQYVLGDLEADAAPKPIALVLKDGKFVPTK